MNQKVLITGKVPKKWLGELTDIASVTIWNDKGEFFMPREKLLLEIGGYDALLNFTDVKTDKELLQKAKKLKIIANCAIGFDNLNIPLLTSHGIWASNAPGFFNFPVAEYVLAGILVLSRRLLEADDYIRKGQWKTFEPGRWDGFGLKERTVGIVGMGATGKELRKLLKALGATVIYHTPSPKKEQGWVPFEELVSTADIISIHIPLTSQTHSLFSSKVFAKIKHGAIIVNTSRGSIVDEATLIEGLEAGRIGGAVLDVFNEEPKVPQKLIKMKNVLLTPHIAGGTKFSREASLKKAVGNIVDALKGNRPLNALNELYL